jgi:CelD/BcsL family acetyltransferase involved in cellulose biosynthesis
MNDIFQLHEKSWNERNSPGVLKGHEIKKFHLEAAKMLLKDKCLKLYRLRYNTLTIAAVYSMVKSDRLYYYIGGFEPEMKKYSPGSVLILSIMEDLIRKGVRKFDFLTGAETYKYNWGAEDEPIFRMIIRKAR